MTTKTAQEYHDRYADAFTNGNLTQGKWHTERDGRHLACALGVIGDDIESLSQCPAQIMPRWLAQMVPAFFDRQTASDAFAWGLAFTEQLARLDGKVPFSVIHDWHANAVCPLGIDAAKLCKRDPSPHLALQSLHQRALTGEKITEDEWRLVLRNANPDAYAYYANADAYPYYAAADAYSYDYAAADAYSYVNAYANAWKRLADGMVECLKRVGI